MSQLANAPSKAAQGLVSMLLGITALLISPSAVSLATDKEEKVTWEAAGNSTMTVENGLRTLTLEEAVIVTQGSLRITGDKAIFEYLVDSNELSRITVYGSPVGYSQQLSTDGEDVAGTSRELRLYTDEITAQSVIELIGDAAITSPDSTMNCAAITYLVDLDLIREAKGPCSGSLSNTPQQDTQ
jgi:lipopolysaccharide transport protein LptA